MVSAPSLSVEERAYLATEARAELGRRHLSDYSRLMQPSTYRQPAQVVALIAALEEVEAEIEAGGRPRLIVEEPPRSSKSTHVSRLFPSWHMGRHPDHGVILASYSDTLATDNGRAVRDYVGSPKYPFVTSIRGDVKAAGRWQTSAGGGLIAVGIGTGLTGWPFPGSLALIDDPVKGRDEAESEVVRANTWTWWQETLLTRIADGGAIVLTGTRWHEDDLIGRVLNSAGASDWKRLRIPYLAEVNDPLGRALDEPLDVFGAVPSVEKGEISAYGFSALYQQRPTPSSGGVFKAEWMERRYCVGHPDGRTCPFPQAKLLPTARFTKIQTVDLGGKQGIGHDPSAIATWGWDGISKYVLDYWSSQDEYADVKAKFKEQNWQHRPRMLYVEDATWAQPIISDLRRESGIRVHAVPATASKWIRADAVSPEFEGGLVVLPCMAHWLDGWLHQHLAFPNAAHDEAVDTTSLALSVLRNAPKKPQAVDVKHTGIPDRESRTEKMRERLKAARRA